MNEDHTITVHNKLLAEKRDLSVYHHVGKSANMISFSSSITLPLKTIKDGDYLHISIVRGPGNLKQECVVDLPDWIDFAFMSVGDGVIRHSRKRTWLTIPPGPPIWQVKITCASGCIDKPGGDYIAIGDSHNIEGV